MKFAQAFRLLISVCSRYCFLFTRPVLCVFYIFIMLLHANAIFFSVAFVVVDVPGSRCICHGYCYIALADGNALFHNTNILFAFFRSFHVFMHSVWTHLIFYASERREHQIDSLFVIVWFLFVLFRKYPFRFCMQNSKQKQMQMPTNRKFILRAAPYTIVHRHSFLSFAKWLDAIFRANHPNKI